MLKSDKPDYADTYGDAVISLSPFSIKKMGLITNQTVLKLDTYNLICVPYRISMKGVVLLGSFSRDEIAFFQRYKGALAGLNLVVQPGDSQTPLKVFCRCSIIQFGAMKGRESVGLISIGFRPCPPDLITLLGEYMMLLDRLRIECKELRDKVVPINPESARALGFNNYATLTTGTGVLKLAIFSLSVNRVEFLMSMNLPDLPKDSPVTLKLFFQKYQFNVPGKVMEAARLPTGVQRGKIELDFSPELVDLLETYYLQAKLGSRSSGGGSKTVS